MEEIPSSQADEAEMTVHELEPEREHFKLRLVQTTVLHAVPRIFEWYAFREVQGEPFSTHRRTRVRLV